MLKRSGGNIRIQLDSGGNAWNVTHAFGDFRITKPGTGVVAFDLKGSGNLTIGGALTQNSSRAVKTDIEPVDDREMLRRIVKLPVYKWKYEADETKQPQVGPMAEDFHEAIGIGDGRHIALGSVSGVSIAAIRGLNEVLEEKSARLEALVEARDAEMAALRARLVALEQEYGAAR